MGRGSYLGGSTIITPGRRGWGVGGTKASKSKKKKIKKKPVSPEVLANRKAKEEAKRRQAFEDAMKNYSLKCGVASFEGRPFPKAPKSILSYMKERESEIPTLVKAHEKFVLDQATKQNIFEKRRKNTKRMMVEFANKSASFYFKHGKLPETPNYLRNFLTSAELQEFISGLRDSEIFVKRLLVLERRKHIAQERQEKQRLKMAKIVVETKPKKRLWNGSSDKR